MHPINDIDVVLLLATRIAAKRRPATLPELFAAIDVLQYEVPGEEKFSDSLERLSGAGLIVAVDGGFALTPAALALMSEQPRKADKGDPATRRFSLRQALAAFPVRGGATPIVLATATISAALQAHQATARGPGKNLMMPKPLPAGEDRKGPGLRQRRPRPDRPHKDRSR